MACGGKDRLQIRLKCIDLNQLREVNISHDLTEQGNRSNWIVLEYIGCVQVQLFGDSLGGPEGLLT